MGLPLPNTLPTLPAPDDAAHPTRGRCATCGTTLQRLWMWEINRWIADRWCHGECHSRALTDCTQRAAAESRARRAAAEATKGTEGTKGT